jgi:hypothetical protein
VPGLVIVCRDDLGVAHDGSEGVSPEGWLPDRVSIGALTKAFPPELVDQVVDTTGTRELRRRLLPARLVVYFVLALWLFRGRNCGYGRVLSKLVDGLYHRRRGRQLLDGVLDPAGWVDAGQGRRWRPPNISNLSRARARLGADPLHMLFEQVAGPVGGSPDGSVDGSAGDPVPGVFCCGLRVVSIDGSTSDLPDTKENAEYFSRPSNDTRDGAFPQVRWLAAAESGTGALIGASFGPYTVGEQTLARDLLAALGPDMLVLCDRNFLSHTLARDVLATGAHILWRASASFTLTPIQVLSDGTYLAVLHPRRKADGPPITVRVIEYTVHTTTPGGAGDEETSEVLGRTGAPCQDRSWWVSPARPPHPACGSHRTGRSTCLASWSAVDRGCQVRCPRGRDPAAAVAVAGDPDAGCAGESDPVVGDPPSDVAEATSEFFHSEPVPARIFGPYPPHQPTPRVVVDRTEHVLGHPVPEVDRPPDQGLVETDDQFVQILVPG